VIRRSRAPRLAGTGHSGPRTSSVAEKEKHPSDLQPCFPNRINLQHRRSGWLVLT